jgi:hypothetical protein
MAIAQSALGARFRHWLAARWSLNLRLLMRNWHTFHGGAKVQASATSIIFPQRTFQAPPGQLRRALV